jgi:glycosyltransferase involved in cell wall biosynthesis
MRPLLLTDSPSLTTGYGNIIRHFGLALRAAGHDAAFGSMNNMGSVLEWRPPDGGEPFKHYQCLPADKIAAAVKDCEPDLVLHMRDPVAHILKWFPAGYSVRANSLGKPCWGWIPVQADAMPWEWIDALHNEYSRVLTFTPSGVEAFGNAGLVRNRLSWLMPGISEAYGPDGDTVSLGRPGVPLGMSVGVPDQDRKMFPLVIRAYREIRDEVDADFYFHTGMLGAFDLPTHARTLSVMGHWLFPLAHDKALGMPEATLAMYYRAASFYVTASTGEGLNMPLMEAAATGLPVVFSDLPTHADAVADYPEQLKFPVRTHPLPRTTTWERLCDVGDLALNLRAAMGTKRSPDAGRAYREAHSWKNTAARFLEQAKQAGIG